MGGQHRSDAFNRLILPRCKGLVEAIGQRLFYEAAKEADLEQAVLDVYQAGIVKHSPGWFAIHAGMDASAQAALEDAAIPQQCHTCSGGCSGLVHRTTPLRQ